MKIPFFFFFKDEIVSHHNYLAPLSGFLPAWITKLAIRPTRVIHLDPQAAVVPGLAGMLFFCFSISLYQASTVHFLQTPMLTLLKTDL